MRSHSSMPSRSSPKSVLRQRRILAPPEVLGPLKTPMVCAVANGFGVLPGKSFRLSSKPFQFNWTSLNHRPHDPFLVSSCLYAPHTPKLVIRLDSLVPTRVCRHQSPTIQAHSRTFQGIPTPSRTERPGQLKRSFPHTQTSHHFCLTITSGQRVRASPGMIEICCRP